jgi:two-component system LytT family response regulator
MILPRNSLSDVRASVRDDDDASASDGALRLVDSTTSENTEPRELAPLIETLLTELRSHRRRNARVVVKTGGKVLFLRSDQIEWVEAAGNYVKLHVGGESHLFRESMKNMEARLDGEMFVRIHRSAIVNVDHIRELQPWFHGEYVVILHDGTRLMASRVFSDRLSRLIA